MAKFIKVILVTLFLYVSVHCIGQPFEIEFDRVEILNKTYVDGFYNVSTLRVQKFNRTKHVVNLNAELLMDIDETIFMEINFYYNRLNNNQYSKTPARLPKTALCKVFDTYYRDLYMENFKEASNFPQYQPDEPACPINKVKIICSIERMGSFRNCSFFLLRRDIIG